MHELTIEPKYEEQFTALIDFLGFTEASTKSDEATRSKILEVLIGLSNLRGEFNIESKVEQTLKAAVLRPAISTFSDHIVISYPLEAVHKDSGSDEGITANIVLGLFRELLVN